MTVLCVGSGARFGSVVRVDDMAGRAARSAEVTGILAEALPLTPATAEAPWVFDLFCGVGLFTLPLAELGYRVVGLERERRAVRALSAPCCR